MFDVPSSLHYKIVEEAQQVCDGLIECFGTVSLQRIDWHKDFSTGFRWSPGKRYTSYRIVDLSTRSDVKVPWELSRAHQLIPPAKAFSLSTNEKYAQWIENHILDWIKENPFAKSINWTCAMDVAIRAVNWIWAIWLCGEYFQKRDSLQLINRSLFEHGLFIRSNLERNLFDYSSNHYYANLVGLIYLGTYFRGTTVGERWFRFGLKEFEKETSIQFLPSGVNYELAIGYHRLVTEMLMSVVCLLRRNGVQVANVLLETAEKAIDYIWHYTRLDGTVPQIGDTDDGRLHIFGWYAGWKRADHRHLLALGHAFFNREKWAQEDESWYQDAAVLLNDPTVYGLAGKLNESPKSRSFPDAGIYIFRDDRWHTIIKVSNRGPHGRHGWHTHNDVLSFDLAINGFPLIVDPGVGEYSGNIVDRNLFRSTHSHNTVMIDGTEQNSFQSGISGMWSNNGEAVGVVDLCEISDNVDCLEAHHNGYLRLRNSVIHRRKFLLDKQRKTFTVIDRFEGSGEHELAWSFILHPEVAADSHDNKIWFLRIGDVTTRFEAPIFLRLAHAWFSPSYKQKQPAFCLRAKILAKMNTDYHFVISLVN